MVTGPPAGGKTTLARGIAADLRWPLFEKDVIKETLFDTLGVGDSDWSNKLGTAALALLLRLAEIELAAGRSAVIEANFPPERADPAFARLARSYEFRAVQVYCGGEPEELVERVAERADTRHPGHVDDEEELQRELEEGRYAPLDLGGPLLEYSVGDVDTGAVTAAVRRALG